MQRSVPLASAGFRMLEASIEPPLVAPAPMTVWISSMNRIAPFERVQLRQHLLQPLLEIASVARAREQRTHIERIDRGLRQHLGHAALDDLARQALGDGGLADAGVTHIEGVVLGSPAEDLDRALDFQFAPDQRVDLAGAGLLVEVDAIGLQSLGRLRLPGSPPSLSWRSSAPRTRLGSDWPAVLAMPWLI